MEESLHTKKGNEREASPTPLCLQPLGRQGAVAVAEGTLLPA